jgi:hypothetical protein
MSTTTTHKPNSVYRLGNPIDRLVRRAEGVVKSLEQSIEYWDPEVTRLRKLARDRAEVGNRTGQADANALADQKQRHVDKLRIERTLATEELETLRTLVAVGSY